MKHPLKAVAAAVLVSSALFAAPATAAEASTSGSVLPADYVSSQQISKSTGTMTTAGMASGANVFWCWFGIC